MYVSEYFQAEVGLYYHSDNIYDMVGTLDQLETDFEECLGYLAVAGSWWQYTHIEVRVKGETIWTSEVFDINAEFELSENLLRKARDQAWEAICT